MSEIGATVEATSAALVGATGGAGTTRTTVELAAVLAADGRDVCLLDAAFATQGLADYVEGRIAPDLTGLLTDEAETALEASLVDLEIGIEWANEATVGRVACCPALAPFERLARAKTVGAAHRFERRIDEAARTFDHVLVDTPPVAANQSVAAVNACDRVVLVAPATARGADAVQRARPRLNDLGVETDAIVSTRGELEGADAALPDVSCDPEDAPACAAADGPFAPAAIRAAETVLGGATGVTVESERTFDRVTGYVSR